MKKQVGVSGEIENRVRDSRLVEGGIAELSKFKNNLPIFSTERRRFLKYAAGLAGWTFLWLNGCGGKDSLNYIADRHWESYLMTQDLIRGPSLLYWRGRYIDFNEHASGSWNKGFGAVDYEVPTGTPVVPTNRGFIRSVHESYQGGKKIRLSHEDEYGDGTYRSSYVHLSKRIIKKKDLSINLSDVIALSGNSGYINTELQPEQLHFQIYQVKDKKSIPPGFDPFKLGVDGGRPVYWDTKTEIVPLNWRGEYLQKTLSTLDQRLKEAEVDNIVREQLLSKRKNPIDYRDYLRVLVSQKHPNEGGIYNHLPGSFLYSEWLKAEAYTSKQPFIAMLPFPHPMLKSFYQKENPGVQF
ncbi:M23 family metallopeptidase [Candidatus Woesearchaeota archaeon]|nr:M23 family metallopeptidase [Candidatus Woesearchaeota archaeon]